MKLLIEEAATAIVFVFGFGVIFWLYSTGEMIRDETSKYQSEYHYGAGRISGELYNDTSQETEPGSENQNVPR